MTKVALVTGADSGIGRAIAERLLRERYALGYATRARDDGARRAHDHLAALGRLHWVSGDLADPDVPERIVRDTCSGEASCVTGTSLLVDGGAALHVFDKPAG